MPDELVEHDWLHFIAASGGQASHWVDEYRSPGCAKFIRLTNRTLALLRRRQIEPAHELLASLDNDRRTLESSSPSLRHALQRLHYSALAYYFYCIEESANAEEALELAHESVRAAIQQHGFLLPFANHCYDFCLQRARIVRNDRRWQSMERYIEQGRAMLENRLPLCVMDDGTPIYVHTIDAFYRSIAAFTAAEKAALEELVNEHRRRRIYESLVDSTYALPWVVIPYP